MTAPKPITESDHQAPPGNHPLEVAARRGIGPLSPLVRDAWHGQTTPCVSCGELVKRDQTPCNHCGQDLSAAMVEKMRAHAGPWFVLEHVRPFPGVSLDRLIRQIRRGVLTEISIVRGPETHYQWRFAVETPGLCRFFNRCWRCHAGVSESDRQCPACHSGLLSAKEQKAKSASRHTRPKPAHRQSARERREPAGGPTFAARPQPVLELEELKSAVYAVSARAPGAAPARQTPWEPPTQGATVRALWLPITLLVAVLIGLMWMTNCRGQSALPRHPIPPALVCPLGAFLAPPALFRLA